jgi:hypothetical protein
MLAHGSGVVANVGRTQVIWNDASGPVEPERGQLRKDLAFIGNSRAKNVVECRDPIRGDHQQRVAEVEDVAHLALAMRSKAA